MAGPAVLLKGGGMMYKRKAKQDFKKHLDFMVLDVICLQIAFLFAYMTRHGFCNPYAVPLYRDMVVSLIFIDLVILILFDTLKNVLKRGYYQEFSATLKHACLVVLTATAYLFLTQGGGAYSRSTLFFMGIDYVLISYVVRLIWKQYLKRWMLQGIGHTMLLVTTSGMAQDVIENMQEHNYDMHRIIGLAILDHDVCGRKISGIPVVSGKDTTADYVGKNWVDEVFISLPDGEPEPEELIHTLGLMGVVVHQKLMKHSDVPGQKQFVENLGNYTVLTSTMNYASTAQLFLKRLLDITGGLAGCILTVLLTFVLGPLIYIQSPCPIFFSQIRVGKNGKKFRMYKFRSMYPDAEERKKELADQNIMQDSRMFKVEYDPRIIGCKRLPDGTVKKGIGNFIRDWSLDEFPQFFNVLKGDMSLVGTRPPTVEEWEQYEFHHYARLAIKPGLSGMWQVSGRNHVTDFEEVVKLDTEYIRKWNLGLDIKILLQTVAVVLRKDGVV